LGDGSIAGELVAAAERLVGMEKAFSPETLLAHLMSVAAVNLKLAGPEPFITRVWLNPAVRAPSRAILRSSITSRMSQATVERTP
jgi:hypothetical protein